MDVLVFIENKHVKRGMDQIVIRKRVVVCDYQYRPQKSEGNIGV